eukprot:g43203.t1
MNCRDHCLGYHLARCRLVDSSTFDVHIAPQAAVEKVVAPLAAVVKNGVNKGKEYKTASVTASNVLIENLTFSPQLRQNFATASTFAPH